MLGGPAAASAMGALVGMAGSTAMMPPPPTSSGGQICVCVFVCRYVCVCVSERDYYMLT
jgi:hypothetical protein